MLFHDTADPSSRSPLGTSREEIHASEKDKPIVNHEDHTAAAKTGISGWEFSINQAVKFLGLTVAILFGVWAPLLYKAAKDGNKSNNAQLSSQLSGQNSQRAVQLQAYSS